MDNFAQLNLSEGLNASLERMAFTKPTPIQAQAIPTALDGRDVLGSAQTGTGKTAAFTIPMVEYLLNNPQETALILTPTRELAKQVMDNVHQLLPKKANIKTAFIIGGESMGKQIAQIKAGARIVIGTPGRINDHLQRGSLKLNKASFLILDETDRMLDMGFGVQLDKIMTYMPQQRQTLMFSATLPKEIIKLSGKYLNNPQRIAIGDTNMVATNITQEVIHIEQGKKYDELLQQLSQRTGSVIVFIKTKYNADKIAKNLRRDGFTSEALHGDLRQNKRDRVMQNFRKQNFRVMVATDIAARGLDVPHIEHVINYDLPQVAEDYIHRMGRTARAGAEGSALCFVASQDKGKWKAIERLLNGGSANDDAVSSRPRRNKNFGHKKPFGNKKPFGKNRSDKKFGDKKFGEKKFTGPKGKTFKNDAQNDNNSEGQNRKPRPAHGAKRNESQTQEGGNKNWSKPNNKKRTGAHAASGKPSHGKPGGFKSDGAKTGGFKSDGGKPGQNRPNRNKPNGGKANGGKPGGFKSHKPGQGKPAGKKSFAGAQHKKAS